MLVLHLNPYTAPFPTCICEMMEHWSQMATWPNELIPQMSMETWVLLCTVSEHAGLLTVTCVCHMHTCVCVHLVPLPDYYILIYLCSHENVAASTTSDLRACVTHPKSHASVTPIPKRPPCSHCHSNPCLPWFTFRRAADMPWGPELVEPESLNCFQVHYVEP